MAFTDQQLQCKECGKNFLWSASEQAFFEQKGFKNAPARCPECRVKARERRKETQAAFKIQCADCGAEGELPVDPQDKKVYCEACFQKIRKSLTQ